MNSSNAHMQKKIIVFGATGTIGKAVVAALSPKYELLQRRHCQYCRCGEIRAAGKLSDEDFRFSLANKLMGQVNLARIRMDYLNAKGSITLTSGILSHKPMAGSAAISPVNAGLEGFARAAALEAPRGMNRARWSLSARCW
jgi:NAD(P)-dependent dehydrogenase (short-subunit alcohol dehydrogenase family)